MSRSMLLAAGAALAFTVCATGTPAAAQTDVEFGDDASQWANDGECDDLRFEGRGMTDTLLLESDLGHDATDCRAAFDKGRITLRADAAATLDGAAAAVVEAPAVEIDQTEAAVPTGEIDYGDDASSWANDNECDDPRFSGEDVAAGAQRVNALHDAADCRAAVEAGSAVYTGELEPLWEGVHDNVDFGDNAGRYPDDGECDDPRFAGESVALGANRVDARHDAHDCRQAYDADAARYVGELDPAFEGRHDGVDFGDNSGSFPFDAECDDPRFTGDNVAPGSSRNNVRGDADDCRAAYDLGEAQYGGELPPLFEGTDQGVDFGDNSGPYVDDDECDDPRFSGAAVAGRPQRQHIRQDAHDCREAVVAGTARYDGELAPMFEGVFEGVDFGDNTGPYTDDGECDDRRFRGHGMALPPWSAESEAHDAADCQALFSKGFVRFVVEDGLFEGRAEDIDFGDNSGAYVNDGECDDSRFEGPGVSMAARDGANDRKDAFDCWVNLQDGSIILKQQNGSIAP